MIDPLDERRRWCVWCGADCWPDPEYQDHDADCPQTTGLYPVTADDLVDGMLCAECRTPFRLGDLYARQLTDDEDVFVIVCVGCRVLHPTYEGT